VQYRYCDIRTFTGTRVFDHLGGCLFDKTGDSSLQSRIGEGKKTRFEMAGIENTIPARDRRPWDPNSKAKL
jgi:hypothetical protein